MTNASCTVVTGHAKVKKTTAVTAAGWLARDRGPRLIRGRAWSANQNEFQLPHSPAAAAAFPQGREQMHSLTLALTWNVPASL